MIGKRPRLPVSRLGCRIYIHKRLWQAVSLARLPQAGLSGAKRDPAYISGAALTQARPRLRKRVKALDGALSGLA